jgi:PPOX class probable FMN-dependent enzyme
LTGTGEKRVTTLKTDADLRAIYKQPGGGAVGKDIGQIDPHFARFIALSPFLCIGTVGENGLCDVSPRGGEPGFVAVLDTRTLAMPDRPGNNRLDSLGNITRNAGVGLLFFVPGFEDTLRVNGLARVTTEPDLMERFMADGKPPRSVVLIDVKEAYLHCVKAIRRAGLWTQDTHVDRSAFPTAGQVYRDQLKLEIPGEAIDASLAADAKDNLY